MTTTPAHPASEPDEPELAALIAALDALRIQGIRAPRPHYGQALLDVLGIPADMSPQSAREFVAKAVLSCASQLDSGIGRAFLDAAGFPPASARGSGARMNSAARTLGVSVRTAYRRIAVATSSIAVTLLNSARTPALQERDWMMMRVNLRVDLRDDEPSMVLEQTIRALREGLDHFDDMLSFPRLGSRPVRIVAIEGCRVDRWRDLGFGASALTLGFDRPLRLGEQHRFAISIRLPAVDALEPVIGFMPQVTSLDATVRILFGKRRPATLELINGVVPVGSFPQVTRPQILDPDVGEYDHTFAEMVPGHNYAIRWSWPQDTQQVRS